MEIITHNEELIPVEYGYRKFFHDLIENYVVAKWKLTLRDGTEITAKTAQSTITAVPPFSNGPWRYGSICNHWEGYNVACIVDEMINRSHYSKFWYSLYSVELYECDLAERPCYRFSLSENGTVNIAYRRHHRLTSWDQYVTLGRRRPPVLCQDPYA